MQSIKNKVAIAAILAIMQIFVASAVSLNSVTISPENTVPGQITSIALEIENDLNDIIENVNVALDLSSSSLPIAPYSSSSEQSIDEIDEDDEETFNFKLIILPEAKSGVYKIPVKISYEINGDEKESTELISLTVSSEPKITLSTDGALIKGRESLITIEIINDGIAEAKFVSIELIDPVKARINSKNYEYIGNIDSDDFDSVEYSLFTEINAGSEILIPVMLKYKDFSNKDYTKTETLKIPVYTIEEAQNRGIIEKPSYTTYIVIAAIVLIYIIYRIIKSIRKRKQ